MNKEASRFAVECLVSGNNTANAIHAIFSKKHINNLCKKSYIAIMDRKKYMRIYIAIIVLLFIHLFVGKFYDEPYPSLLFPAFSETPKEKNVFEIKFLKLYVVDNTNDTLLVEKEDLLPLIAIHIPHALETIKLKEEIINDSVNNHGTQKQQRLLNGIVLKKKSLMKLMATTLKQKFPDKTFSWLIINEGVRRYDTKTQNKEGEILSSNKTIIKLL